MTDAEATTQPQVTTIAAVDTVVVRGVVPTAELPAFFDRSFAALGAATAGTGVTPAGPAFAYYASPPEDVSELEVGFPVDEPIKAQGEVEPSRLPAGQVATVVHHGGYEDIGRSWQRLLEWVSQQGLSPAPGCWEVYLTEPTPDGDPADNRTALYLQLLG